MTMLKYYTHTNTHSQQNTATAVAVVKHNNMAYTEHVKFADKSVTHSKIQCCVQIKLKIWALRWREPPPTLLITQNSDYWHYDTETVIIPLNNSRIQDCDPDQHENLMVCRHRDTTPQKNSNESVNYFLIHQHNIWNFGRNPSKNPQMLIHIHMTSKI